MSMNFDDLTNRILNRLDKFEDKFDNTCNTISQLKSDFNLLKLQLDSHLEEKEKQAVNNNRKFYIIMALMGTGFTIFEVIQGL